MKRSLFSIAIILTLLSMSACNKDFEETNTNPNTVPVTRPESLLESAIYRMVQANQTRALRLTHELMQVHVTTVNSDEIHRYIIRPSESDYMWNAWYLQITNFRDMYNSAKELALVPSQSYYYSYMGIARVMEAWSFSLLTDTYGDVPFSEATLGRSDNIYQPKFDRQQDIYDSLFKNLEEANTLFARNDTLIPDAAKQRDPLYGGSISKWRKFSNALYLRLLLRASGRPESNAAAKIQQIIATPATYPLMASNEESAVIRFTTTPPFVSAFNTYRDFDFNGDNGLSQFFINTLNFWEDPRRTKWASTVGSNYEGVPSGYMPGQVPERLSFYLAALKNEPRLGNILSYPELQFILAEAALKGYSAGNAKTLYENGVNNAITFWALTVPTGHLAKPGVAWVDAETDAQKLEKIITQKYFTFFFTDFQSWFEYRRTGYPDLPIGPGVQNNRILPTRLVYPTIVQSLNRVNYNEAVSRMGGDNMLIKVWWDVN